MKLICQQLGMELVADLPFKSDVTDAQFDSMVAQLDKTGAQMVFNHGGIATYEKLIYDRSNHKGLEFVDISIITRDAKFRQ